MPCGEDNATASADRGGEGQKSERNGVSLKENKACTIVIITYIMWICLLHSSYYIYVCLSSEQGTG